MATKLLPSAEIRASKKTISADSITSIGKNSSNIEKLSRIRSFLALDYKRDLFSFKMKKRQQQDQKRKAREEKIEKKETKPSLPSFKIANPFQDIFSSIGNFLLFLGGGILFNKIYDAEKGLMGVAKVIEGIGKGIDFVASMVGSLTNFIDSTVLALCDKSNRLAGESVPIPISPDLSVSVSVFVPAAIVLILK